MSTIRCKSISEAIDRVQDGLRIVVTRYLPRGVSRGCYDVWMPNLAPSEQLLKSYQSGATDWKKFSRAYEQELFEVAAVDGKNPRIKNRGQKFTLRLLKQLAARHPVTLICSCGPDEPCCHRHLLAAILSSSKI